MKKLCNTAPARYTPFPLPDFAGNPLIEALNPLYDENNNLDDELRVLPKINEEELKLSATVRRLLPRRLNRIFLPNIQHRKVTNLLYSLVLDSYSRRNPLSPEGEHFLYNDGLGNCRGASNEFGRIGTLLGPSGMGKSTTVGMGLSAIGPQVIHHTTYDGQSFHETQLLYHYLRVTESLRPEDIYLHAARTAALRTGNALLRKAPGARRSPEEKRDYCRMVMRSSHAGVLILDNCEYMFRASKSVAQQMLAMVINIRDDFELPVLLVGTCEADKHLRADDSVASRFSEGGYCTLDRPTQWNDPDWNDLVETLWSYCWTRYTVELDETLKKFIFEKTQGVTRFLLVLLVQAQIMAIDSGHEKVDELMLTAAYNEWMRPVHHIIEALGTEDPGVMAAYESMYMDSSKLLPSYEKNQLEEACDSVLNEKLAQIAAANGLKKVA